MGRPALNDSELEGALAALTPIISVVKPNRSRAAINPQIPEPMPIPT